MIATDHRWALTLLLLLNTDWLLGNILMLVPHQNLVEILFITLTFHVFSASPYVAQVHLVCYSLWLFCLEKLMK